MPSKARACFSFFAWIESITRGRPWKWANLKKKEKVVTLVCTILCYAGRVSEMVSSQNIYAREREQEDLYFSLPCPLSCEVLKSVWNLSLLMILSAIAREGWQEGNSGDHQHTLQQYWLGWRGEASFHWTSHCPGELGLEPRFWSMNNMAHCPALQWSILVIFNIKSWAISYLFKNILKTNIKLIIKLLTFKTKTIFFTLLE